MSTPKWEKVLWKKQPFPDNYIPEDAFLSSLRKNRTGAQIFQKSPSFNPDNPTFGDDIHILVHIARLKDYSLDPHVLIFVSLGCFMLGYFVWKVLRYTQQSSKNNGKLAEHVRADGMKSFKSFILIFLALMSLSPVLKTLSAATSSDSIWALSACLFLLNILLADYGSSSPVNQGRPERLTSVLSMNAAISSSVVLASRLSTDLAVFALILFSVQSFTLFPMLRRRLQAFNTKKALPVQVLLTLFLSVLSLVLTAPLSATVAYLFLFILFAITFLAPAVLVWAQKYKNEIRGPWDVAVPKVN